MAKIGDHVMTIYGPASIIFGRRIAVHHEGDAGIYELKPGLVLNVIKTKEQLEAERSDRDVAAWHFIVNGK